MDFVLASNNAHKVEEFRAVFNPYGINVYSLKDLQIQTDPEETGTTFEENALIKAEAVARYTDKIVIADDSGLEIRALEGFPGIHSARFMKDHPYEEKFSAIQEMLKGKEDRTANFNCTIAVLHLEDRPLFFVGKVFGFIAEAPSGSAGFGYDPIFYYPEAGKTFAECSSDEKNRVSHRGAALGKLLSYLKEKRYI